MSLNSRFIRKSQVLINNTSECSCLYTNSFTIQIILVILWITYPKFIKCFYNSNSDIFSSHFPNSDSIYQGWPPLPYTKPCSTFLNTLRFTCEVCEASRQSPELQVRSWWGVVIVYQYVCCYPSHLNSSSVIHKQDYAPLPDGRTKL